MLKPGPGIAKVLWHQPMSSELAQLISDASDFGSQAQSLVVCFELPEPDNPLTEQADLSRFGRRASREMALLQDFVGRFRSRMCLDQSSPRHEPMGHSIALRMIVQSASISRLVRVKRPNGIRLFRY